MTAGNDMKSMLVPDKVQDTGPPEPNNNVLRLGKLPLSYCSI